MINVEKAIIIDNLYEPRKSQQYVADKLGMSISDVSKTTQILGYHHGTTELKKLLLYENEFSFLSKYPDENFEEYK